MRNIIRPAALKHESRVFCKQSNMKWLNLSGINLGLSFRYLIRRDQGLREGNIVVVSPPGSKKDVPRDVVRPWHPLPNVKKFKIKLRPWDWLFMLAGLAKRTQPKLEFHTWKNAAMNKYVDYMFKRLRKQVENKLYRKALKTIWILMSSVSYQIVAYNHVCHNWYRKKPLWLVKQQLRHVNKLIEKKSHKIEYHRAYIPKGNTWRPLGVPSVAWRVYLHMLNNVIVEWRMVTESDYQHGFIPGRGVLTAWKRLFKLLRYPYVYEIDYEKFFDSVSLTGLSSQMVRMGFPARFANFIEQINRFPIDLEYVYLNELNVLSKIFNYTDNNPNFRFKHMSDLVKEAAEFRRNGNYIWYNIQQYFELADKYYDRQFRKLTKQEMNDLEYGFLGEFGVPQGAPTSCSLATLAIRIIEERIKAQGLDMVAYADDVILAGPTEFDPKTVLEDHNLGLKVNWSKSGWVKYAGIWRATSWYPIKDEKSNEKGIKFLGIRYHPALWVELRDYLRYMCRPAHIINSGLHPEEAASPHYNLQPIRLVDILKEFRRRNGLLELIRSEWHAETRNGARLRLTLKISFLAYLAKARNLAIKYINSPYVKQYATLGEWLKDCDNKWSVLRDQVKSVTKSPIYGWIVSRMQNDSWSKEGDTLQNFQWRATRLSWADLRWRAYKFEHNIEGRITIFTGSSFACHDLANWLRRFKNATKSR